jgi:hypothetical protein
MSLDGSTSPGARKRFLAANELLDQMREDLRKSCEQCARYECPETKVNGYTHESRNQETLPIELIEFLDLP